MIINREKWTKEIEVVNKITCIQDEIISLNVGGKSDIMTTKELLNYVPGSKLSMMFSDRHKLRKVEGDKIFIDRNGRMFESLIDYLRDLRDKEGKIGDNY